ncbi:hypothetical protein AB0K40_09985 [Nonomuraea bangladeshensis]|uniref:Uncharacterized protein n=1 Tax=Nonomuraea bangladeshensis TaxID=404385 RepID=A0ABV3GZX5_9ACTN
MLAAASVLVGMVAVVVTPQTAVAAVADTSIYPVQSIYPLSTDYRLTVNGRNVPVQKHAGYNGYQGYDVAHHAPCRRSSQTSTSLPPHLHHIEPGQPPVRWDGIRCGPRSEGGKRSAH